MKRLFLLVLGVVFSCGLFCRGHIVYLCYDPVISKSDYLVRQLEEWKGEGDMYLYIQDRRDYFNHIVGQNDFNDEISYLRSVGITNIVPQYRDLQNISFALEQILRETTFDADTTWMIHGELDNKYVMDFVMPSIVFSNQNNIEKFKRFISINNLDKRFVVSFWSLRDDEIRRYNIYDNESF